jgi:hypothetical protein
MLVPAALPSSKSELIEQTRRDEYIDGRGGIR